jgi:hypothetical protein
MTLPRIASREEWRTARLDDLTAIGRREEPKGRSDSVRKSGARLRDVGFGTSPRRRAWAS